MQLGPNMKATLRLRRHAPAYEGTRAIEADSLSVEGHAMMCRSSKSSPIERCEPERDRVEVVTNRVRVKCMGRTRVAWEPLPMAAAPALLILALTLAASPAAAICDEAVLAEIDVQSGSEDVQEAFGAWIEGLAGCIAEVTRSHPGSPHLSDEDAGVH